MREEIIQHLDNPAQLEKLYRSNKLAFKKEFNHLFPYMEENTTARIWHERLNFESESIGWGTSKELLFVIIAALLAWLTAEIPRLTGIEPDRFYPRNLSLIVLPGLAAYFTWKNKPPLRKAIITALVFCLSALYINLLPANDESDTFVLACIHLPLVLWVMTGVAFTGRQSKNYQQRISYLRYNGDLLVMTAVILLAGGLFTGITAALFEVIGIRLEDFYLEHFIKFGLSAAPIAGTYLTQVNPQLVNKVSPVIAKIFTPLVLAMLVIYLVAVILTGQDPFNDREFLLIFNVMLIGVMAIILFSIAETMRNSESRVGVGLLLALSVVAVCLNAVALSAILLRISEWGITPNRLAVLGANLLMLTHLAVVAFGLYKLFRDPNQVGNVEKNIALFLPIYALWTVLVAFGFPILFGFR